MRTAKEIIMEVMVTSMIEKELFTREESMKQLESDWEEGGDELRNLFTEIVNTARKETIEECAKVAKINEGTNNWQKSWVDKQSILSLIDELK